jgi:HAD superfamily phosphoserine phosphatase-like hydrolase
MPRLIAFDVDSTLLSVESLDYAIARAARIRGGADLVATAVEKLTDQGMAGQLGFRKSLAGRLEIGRLTRTEVFDAADEIAQLATPGMAELLSGLREAGDRVVAVSGGFRELISDALYRLGFEDDEIFANDFIWMDEHAMEVETSNPLSDNGGKPTVLAALDGSPKIMIGDGATDLEAFTAGAADHFIGFGGVKTRPDVRKKAPRFAREVAGIDAILNVL